MPIAPTVWNGPRNTPSGGQHEMLLDITLVVSESEAFGGRPTQGPGVPTPYMCQDLHSAVFSWQRLGSIYVSLSPLSEFRIGRVSSTGSPFTSEDLFSPLRTTYQRTLHDISQPSTHRISFRNVTSTDTPQRFQSSQCSPFSPGYLYQQQLDVIPFLRIFHESI